MTFFSFFLIYLLNIININTNLNSTTQTIQNIQNKKHPKILTLNKNPDDFFKLPSPQKISVWILIVDPGKDLFSTFGHSAFLIRFPNGDEKVYDFGNFSLEKRFIGNVIKNKAIYFTEKKDFSYFLDSYQNEKREIRALKLNLSETKINFLLKRLKQIINSSEKFYTYNHFSNNCTTKMRDLLAQTIKGNFRESLEQQTENSWRTSLNQILKHSFWFRYTLNFLFSSQADKHRNEWNGMYLPSVMEKTFLNLKIKINTFDNPKPLITKYMIISEGQKQYFTIPKYIIAIIIIFLLTILTPIIVWKHRIVFKVTLFIFSLIQTTLFLILFIMHIYHPVTSFNLNILCVLPFILAIFPLWKNSNLKTSNRMIKILIISLFLPIFEILLRPITIQKTFPYPEFFIIFIGIFLFVAISIRLNFKKSIIKLSQQIQIKFTKK